MPCFSTGVTVISPGFWTRHFTTNSSNACIAVRDGDSGGGRRGLLRLANETGDGIARLRALAHPVIGAIQVQRVIVALFERQVGAEFLNALAVAGAAAVGDDDTER